MAAYKTMNRTDTARAYRPKPAKASKGAKERVGGLSFAAIADQNPPLQQAECRALMQKKGTPDWPEARSKLILGHIRLVISIAKKYAWIEGTSMDDLISQGVLGMMKAIDNFDPNAGAKLSTYGTYWIQHEIRSGILFKHGSIRNPAYMERLINRLNVLREESVRETGQEPTVADLALRMGLPEKKIKVIWEIAGFRTVSIDQPAGLSDGRERTCVGDRIMSNDDVESEALKRVTRKELARAINGLNPVERDALLHRYGFVGEGPMTIAQCAKRIGYSEEGCRRILIGALQKIRDDFLGIRGDVRATA